LLLQLTEEYGRSFNTIQRLHHYTWALSPASGECWLIEFENAFYDGHFRSRDEESMSFISAISKPWRMKLTFKQNYTFCAPSLLKHEPENYTFASSNLLQMRKKHAPTLSQYSPPSLLRHEMVMNVVRSHQVLFVVMLRRTLAQATSELCLCLLPHVLQNDEPNPNVG
jgi:hypothetical protein